VVTTWDECKNRTNGVPGARFKSFTTEDEAHAFVKSGGVEETPTQFYAVWVGRTPGVYTSWTAAQEQVAGFGGARFKGFPTLEEAQLHFNAGPPVKTTTEATPSNEPKEVDAQVCAEYGNDPPF
jgi:viroplasmin and RNaseH domain-containing protein